jgi:hypothetical protein
MLSYELDAGDEAGTLELEETLDAIRMRDAAKEDERDRPASDEWIGIPMHREGAEERAVSGSAVWREPGELVVAVVADVSVVRVKVIVPRSRGGADLVGATRNQDRRRSLAVNGVHAPERVDATLERDERGPSSCRRVDVRESVDLGRGVTLRPCVTKNLPDAQLRERSVDDGHSGGFYMIGRRPVDPLFMMAQVLRRRGRPGRCRTGWSPENESRMPQHPDQIVGSLP